MISHTMKIWERILDRRLREETSIGEGQFGFMPGRGTTDAIFAARQVIKKHREMQKALHLVFIDLDKAYDRVPRQEVWRCLREQGVPGKYVRLVKDTYEDVRTQVKTSIGLTGNISVRVGLHQGSSLSPYLFDISVSVLAKNALLAHHACDGTGHQRAAPWCMLFADDIVLCSTRSDHVERKLEEWRRAMEEREDWRLVEGRLNTWGAMNSKMQRSSYRERQSREWRHSHTWNRRSRRMENWMRKSPTECRAGGRTGRECLECCATGEWT